MKRKVSRSAWLGALLAMLLLASACAAPVAAPAATSAGTAADAPATGSSSSESAAGEAVTITHWQHHFESRAAIVEELAAQFEAAHPGVTIDFQSIPYNDYFSKIAPSLEAGTGPDVFQIPGSQLQEFYAQGYLQAVPENVYSAADIEADFVPWTVDLLRQGDAYYGLPTDVQPFLLFYNDALFTEAGLDPTKDFATWEELEAAATALTKVQDGVMTQAGISLTYSPYQWYWWLLTTLSDNGIVDGDLNVTYNTPEGVAAWSAVTGLLTNLGVDNAEFLAGQNKFALGMAGMDLHEYAYAGSVEATAPDLEFSVHMPPPLPGRPEGTAGTHWAYVVSEQSPNADLAWEWTKFLTSAEAQETWVAGGGELPSFNSFYGADAASDDPNVAAALASMSKVAPFDDLGWDDVYGIHQTIWDEITLNGTPVEDAVAAGAAAEEELYVSKGLK